MPRMKGLFSLLLPLLLLSLFLPKIVEARSGCCSHHGGVCGCGCCDGTALSNTCAPYYPSCSEPVYVAPVATQKPSTPRPTIKPISTPTQAPTAYPIATTTPSIAPTNTPEVKGLSTIEPTPTPKPLNGIEAVTSFGSLGFFSWLGWKGLKWLGQRAGGV